MTVETDMAIAVGLVVVAVAAFAAIFVQICRQGRDIEEQEARDERRRRETEIEHAIARRRERERASPAETPDAPGG